MHATPCQISIKSQLYPLIIEQFLYLSSVPFMGHPFQHASSEIYGQTPYDNFMIYKNHKRHAQIFCSTLYHMQSVFKVLFVLLP